MNMNKLIVFAGMIIALGAALALYNSGNQTPAADNGAEQAAVGKQIILYYGDGCSHCDKVHNYINEYKAAEKISFIEKEVNNNSANAAELAQKALACGLRADSISIPLLWDGEKCLIGDEDVINFFKEKISVSR